MLRSWVLALLVGCSFEPGQLTSRGDAADLGDGGSDGDAPDAAAPDGPSGPPIVFVQGAVATNAGNNASVMQSFPLAQTAGNLNVVVISWTDQNDNVLGVADTNLNTYLSATQEISAQGFTQRIYYASDIEAGANLVTVTLTGNVPNPKIRIFEYAGIATSLPVDKVSSSNGSSATSAAGPITTTQDRELLFAANVVATATTAAGTDFTERQLDVGDMVQDRVVTAAGTYSTDAPLSAAGGWIMQLVAFKGAP